MTELPAFDRLKLRVLVGSLRMLEGQIAELPEPLRAHVFAHNEWHVARWREWAAELHASTTSAPTDVTRPKTMDAA